MSRLDTVPMRHQCVCRNSLRKNTLHRLLGRDGRLLGLWCGPILLALSLLFGAQAHGEEVPTVDQAIAARNIIIQRFTPPPRLGSADIAVEDQRRVLPDARAAGIRLRLRSVTVEGVVTVSLPSLAPLWQGKIGTEITVAELYRLAEAIDAAYERAGYFAMTVVPVQDFRLGHVRLRVYESYVASVEITSEIPGIAQRLQPYIDRIVAMRPIDIKEAERILSLMSDLGGLQIEGIFVRPNRPTGGGTLRLNVGFERSSAIIGLDNLGTDEVGPLELSTQLVMNDLLGLFDSLTLVAVTVPDDPDELGLIQLSHDIPLGHDGLAVGYRLTYLSAHPGGPSAAYEIASESRSGSVYLSYPFLRTLDRSLFGEIEVKAQSDATDMQGKAVERRKARWLLGSLRYDHVFATGSLAGSMSLGQGIGHDHGSVADIEDDYRFGQMNVEYNRQLGDSLSLRVRATGQYAPDPIPGPVRFSLGGDPYGWAFDTGSLSGDSGAATAVELSHALDTRSTAFGTVALSAFVDYGAVWNRSSSAEMRHDTLGSLGLGVAGMLDERFTFQLLAATPWHEAETAEAPGTRLFFRIGMPL